jgi:hypothetical protein
MLLRPDSEFFRFFGSSSGRMREVRERAKPGEEAQPSREPRPLEEARPLEGAQPPVFRR